jgi:hypothetical protein
MVTDFVHYYLIIQNMVKRYYLAIPMHGLLVRLAFYCMFNIRRAAMNLCWLLQYLIVAYPGIGIFDSGNTQRFPNLMGHRSNARVLC